MVGRLKLSLLFSNKPLQGCLAVIVALVADQASPAAVLDHAHRLSAAMPVVPGFNLVFTRNEGVTFGLLSGTPWWFLTVLAVLISLWIASIMLRSHHKVEVVGCGLILGGALGNIADRIRHGGVTDFLDFYVGNYHWPSFNLADVAVVCGVSLLIFHQIRNPA